MEPVDDAQQRMSQPSLSHSRSLYSKRTSILTPEEQKDQQSGIRYVRFNDHSTNASRNFPSNQLRTAKYNALNMIPKALFEQFRRVANFYFLVIAIVSFVPGVSPSTPAASVLPLLVVVGFGFARDVYEDGKRAAEDRRQNSEKQIIMARRPESVDAVDRKVSLVSKSLSDRLIALNLQPEIHRTVASRNIAVGDIVFLRKGQVFPCDMVLLHSSTDGGIAYVSTANLDGESNLKRTLCAAPTSDLKYPSELLSLHGKIRAQQPATALYDFDASILLSGHEPAPLSASNLLLRGSILRNTSYVYGLAVYTGFDTKVALNMRNPPSKMGNVEKKLNWIVLILFVILAILISACSGAAAALQANQAEGQWYMDEFSDRGSGSVFARSLGTFLILFSTFIPVSLFVTLEFIRVIQALFMSADYRMKTKGRSVAARATNLNETLGEIEHILSDKTGTLTENEMRYIACSAGGNVYNIRKKRRDMHNAVKKDVKPVKLLLLAMALCHSVVPEPKSEGSEPLFDDDDSDGKKKKKMRAFRNSKKTESADAANANQSDDDSNDGLPSYQGQSPDEVALVTSARKYGIGLLRRTIDTLVIDHFGTEEEYTALAELEFNSDRKRMSMIFKCPDRKIRMYTKGADTIMLPLLRNNLDMQLVQDHIDEFAKEGLRTLVFAKRDFTPQEFEPWFARFQEASNSLDDREAKVSALSAEIETDLEFIATTAVEDKLQDKVPETIKFMREAGVKLWVLTGDKRETAENIGYSANLLDRDMDVRHIKGATSKEVRSQLSGTLDDHILDEEPRSFERARSSSIANFARRLSLRDKKKVEEKEVGIIIDGKSLSFAIEDHAELFMALSDHAKVVICCRVTPLQKALVVRLVREERKAVTLAIGDGGNDVSMIQEAHVGVGIYGKEGTQAARSADYAVGEFKHLLRLTALHGRFSVVRTAGMINLSFYKNIFFTLTQVLFQPFAFVSGVTFNNQWISAAFNVIVTSASPFLYGIFERDVDEGTALRFPSVYGSNRDKKLFSIKSFLEYTMLYGLWHAVVVFFGVYLLFGYLRIGFSDGRDSGLFLVGLANSTIVTLMTLFKILLHSHTLNWIVLLFMALSLGVYVAVVPLSISLFQDYPMEGQLVALFSSPLFYLSAAVIMVGGFVLDFTVLSIRQLVKPNMVDRLRVWERDVRRNKAA